MSDRHRQLVELVREQVGGDRFRSAFRYDADSWDALYVRSDLATARLEAVVPSLADRARSEESLIRESDYPPPRRPARVDLAARGRGAGPLLRGAGVGRRAHAR